MNSGDDIADPLDSVPDLCVGLCRFLGTLAGLAASLGLFKVLAGRWGYSFETVGQAWQAGAKGKALLLFSGLAGLLGGLIGQSVGASIRIKNDQVALRINVLWHLIANGQIGWIGSALALLTLTMRDKNATIAFMKLHGLRFGLSAMLISAVGSTFLAPVIWAFLASPRRLRDESWRAGVTVISFSVGISIGLLQSHLWGLSMPRGAILGFLFGLFLIPASSHMWQRDQQMRFNAQRRPAQ